jgi:hypothetical protein
MSRIPKLLLNAVFALLLPISALAATPADNQIKNALYDIDRYEKQIAGKTTLSKATANRTLKLLGIAKSNLESSPNKDHPTWQDANQRLAGLIVRIQTLAGGTSSTAQSGAPAAAAQVQLTPKVQSGGQSGAQMISHQRVQLKKLTRDVKSSTATLDSKGPKPFQSPEYVQKRTERLNYFKQVLARFAQFQTDPDYVAAQNAITIYENMLAFGTDHAQKELASLGDVQARLQAMADALQKTPNAPSYPYADGEINEWVIALAKIRNTAERALPYLTDIQQRAYLPNTPATRSQGAAFDSNDVNSLIHGYQDSVRTIDQSLETFKANLDAQVGHIADTLGYFNGLNPMDSNQQISAFIGKGAKDKSLARLAETRQLAAAAVSFAELIKSPKLAAYQETLRRVDTTASAYRSKHLKATKSVRLPKAASTDKSLLKIARETLANPKYEIGEVKRIVINADKQHHEKETSEDKYDKVDVSLSGDVTLTGTRTTYFYEWDQFQVATAEKGKDGSHFIYYTTFKYYTRGASTTPLNKWIISGRIQGSEIAESLIQL